MSRVGESNDPRRDWTGEGAVRFPGDSGLDSGMDAERERNRRAAIRVQAGCLGSGVAGVAAAAGAAWFVNRRFGPFTGPDEILPLGAAVLAMAVVLIAGVAVFGVEEIPPED